MKFDKEALKKREKKLLFSNNCTKLEFAFKKISPRIIDMYIGSGSS